MGACSSTVDEDDQAVYDASKNIDKENAKDFQISSRMIKLLLLGAGECGKSTVFKQMRLLYGEAYSEEENMSFKLFIHQNVVDTIEQLCVATRDTLPEDVIIESKQFMLIARDIVLQSDAYRKFPELTPDYAEAAYYLWTSESFRSIWKIRSQFQISDTSAVFLDRIQEISQPAYRPSQTDIILARVRTTGIREERLKIDNQIFQFFDVGGQRNERRKWINCFDGVHGVIFVAALSDYNQTLFEDNVVNRMTESLDLFEQTCAEEAFTRSAMILFLNKSDLFQEKIATTDISSIAEFNDYKGKKNDFDEGVEYFLMKFLARNKLGREIFHHVTNATDTSSINFVFNACKSVIIQRSLEDIGFLS